VSAFGSFRVLICLADLVMCAICVLRFLCLPDEVCRFRHCRRCGSVCESGTDSFGFSWLRCLSCGWRAFRVMRHDR